MVNVDGSGSSPDSGRPKKSCLRSCFGCFVTISVGVAIVCAIAFWMLDRDFSIRSNLIFIEFRNSGRPLQVRDEKGDWVPLEKMSTESLTGALRDNVSGNGFRMQTLRVRREAHNWRESMLNTLIPGKVHVVAFDPDKFAIEPWFVKDTEQFRPLTFRDVLRAGARGTRFAINANYYDPEGKPLGWIVKDGQEIQRQGKNWSGFFFVKDGQPWFGPRSLLEATPGTLTQATQGYPSVMKDGQIWNYVTTNQDEFFNGSELTFRSLAGTDAAGNIVFVLSGQGGLMNMSEVTEIARLAGVAHATLLDGGKALQYGLSGPEGRREFHSFNNTVTGDFVPLRFAPERPPVFLLVTRKE